MQNNGNWNVCYSNSYVNYGPVWKFFACIFCIYCIGDYCGWCRGDYYFGKHAMQKVTTFGYVFIWNIMSISFIAGIIIDTYYQGVLNFHCAETLQNLEPGEERIIEWKEITMPVYFEKNYRLVSQTDMLPSEVTSKIIKTCHLEGSISTMITP